MSEVSEHCLCDKCSGEDCEAMEVPRVDVLAVLEAFRKRMAGEYSIHNMWVAEASLIKRLRENPREVVEQGRKEGWWKK